MAGWNWGILYRGFREATDLGACFDRAIGLGKHDNRHRNQGWQEQLLEGFVEQRPPDFQIGIESPQQEEVVEMIEALDTYLNSVYPDGPNYLLDVESLTAESVSFLVARVDGQATGCGALLDHHEYAEIKRMFVKPEARGLGIGAAILKELERLAREEGSRVVLLETGIYQPEALGLYKKAGYVERGPFGDYPPDPISVFMEKDLEETLGHVI